MATIFRELFDWLLLRDGFKTNPYSESFSNTLNFNHSFNSSNIPRNIKHNLNFSNTYDIRKSTNNLVLHHQLQLVQQYLKYADMSIRHNIHFYQNFLKVQGGDTNDELIFNQTFEAYTAKPLAHRLNLIDSYILNKINNNIGLVHNLNLHSYFVLYREAVSFIAITIEPPLI